jgi:Mn2+/Fe2+ NRAMP family transporter
MADFLFICLRTLIGLTLNFTKQDPIKALVWAAIINGITAAPVMCFMMLLASRSKVMGRFTLPFYLKILGWFATANYGGGGCRHADSFRKINLRLVIRLNSGESKGRKTLF